MNVCYLLCYLICHYLFLEPDEEAPNEDPPDQESPKEEEEPKGEEEAAGDEATDEPPAGDLTGKNPNWETEYSSNF